MTDIQYTNLHLVRVGSGQKTHVACDLLIDGQMTTPLNTDRYNETVCPAGSNTRRANRQIRAIEMLDETTLESITCKQCRAWVERNAGEIILLVKNSPDYDRAVEIVTGTTEGDFEALLVDVFSQSTPDEINRFVQSIEFECAAYFYQDELTTLHDLAAYWVAEKTTGFVDIATEPAGTIVRDIYTGNEYELQADPAIGTHRNAHNLRFKKGSQPGHSGLPTSAEKYVLVSRPNDGGDNLAGETTEIEIPTVQQTVDALAERAVAYKKIHDGGNQESGRLLEIMKMLTADERIIDSFVNNLRAAEYDATYREILNTGEYNGAIIPNPHAGGIFDLGYTFGRIRPSQTRRRLFADTCAYLQKFYPHDPAAVIEYMLQGLL